MGGAGDKLLEAQTTEELGDLVVGLLVKADIEIASDDCEPLQVQELIQALHHILLAPFSGPMEKGL